MPADFDFDEELKEETEEVVSSMVQSLQNDDMEEPTEDYMSAVDKRLAVASSYRVLMEGGFFQSETEATAIVEKEVRGYVRSRLEVLLGVKTEGEDPVASVFNNDEIVALKALAKKVMEKPKLVETTPQKQNAIVPKVIPPQVQRKVVPQTPQVQRKVVPADAVTKPTKPATSKPVTKPQGKKPVGRPKKVRTVEVPVDCEGHKAGDRVEIEVVEQVKPSNALPMPDTRALEAVSASLAQQAIGNISKNPAAMAILGRK